MQHAADTGSVDVWSVAARLGEEELAYCNASPRRCDERMAARVLTKSLVLRTLEATSARDPHADAPWRAVECHRDERGAPSIHLSAPLLAMARRAGWTDLHVSWSHTECRVSVVLIVELETD